jgi:hypothetical protein
MARFRTVKLSLNQTLNVETPFGLVTVDLVPASGSVGCIIIPRGTSLTPSETEPTLNHLWSNL